MKLFGLTGGVGMGKSTAAHWLQQHGIAVVDTDVLARQIVEPGLPAFLEIQREFGMDMVGPDGGLLRDKLAAKVFSDPAARETLERITHPRIRELWLKQIQSWRAQSLPVAVVVIPLLYETGAEQEFDATVCVACSTATQQKRLAERGWTPAQIEQRLASQFPIHQKIAKANYVAWSEGPIDVLGAQLERVFKTV